MYVFIFILGPFGFLSVNKVGVSTPLFLTFEANRAMGIYIGYEGGGVVSPPCKIPKIRKLGQPVPLHGFIELQECISGNRPAESAGWNKFRAALRRRGWCC